MKHSNPYKIHNPDDFFEVSENSSHPELQDAKRVWRFGGYTFLTATELKKFFEAEGLNPANYVQEPYFEKNVVGGKNRIIINVIERWKSRNEAAIRGVRM